MQRTLIKNEIRDDERAYYGSKNTDFENITIEGPADGESAFKESRDISVINSKLNLRYPFWHVVDLKVKFSKFSETCRAAFWYSKNIDVEEIELTGVKAFRECEKINLTQSKIKSEELFWRCNKINVRNSILEGFYGFFQSKNIEIDNIKFTGKYSFQYTENVEICDATLDTKDAFWHSKNVTVRNSVIKGEYLGWYSENLTLINCKIIGTQPLCYAKGLKIIDCTMEACDLSFEYSECNAIIVGKIDSIKNPLKGKVICEHCDEFIINDDDRSNGEFELTEVN